MLLDFLVSPHCKYLNILSGYSDYITRYARTITSSIIFHGYYRSDIETGYRADGLFRLHNAGDLD